jgi:hypothetical protein
MRWVRIALVVVALAALAPAPAAWAGSSSLASCAGTWKVSFRPGVELTADSSAFTTNGRTGTVLCVGTVDGALVTGPGTFGKHGVFVGSCLAGEGSGKISVAIPTTAGVKHVEFPFTMVTGPGLGFKFGDSLFGPLTFLFTPSKGTCVLTPVTEITVAGQFSLRT